MRTFQIYLQPEGSSFKTAKVLSFEESSESLLFQATILLYHERITHVRVPIWSDIGGFAFFLYLGVGIIMFPLSEKMFMLNAIKRLYLARSRDTDLFPKSRKFFSTRRKQQGEFKKHMEPSFTLKNLFCNRKVRNLAYQGNQKV